MSGRGFRRRPFGWASFWVLFASGAVVSCDLLIDFNKTQCVADEDCLALGPAFDGSKCGGDGVCTIPKSDAGAPSACSVSACSDFFGSPGICSNRVCQQLAQKGCLRPYPPLKDDKAFVLPYFAPLTPTATATFTPFGIQIQNIMELAATGYNEAVASIPNARPAIVLACDEVKDISLAAGHIVDTLGLRAVIGGYDDAGFAKLLQTTRPKGAVAFAAFASDPQLSTTSSTDGLYWSARPSRAYHEKYVAAEVAEVKQVLQARDSVRFANFSIVIAADGNLASQSFATTARNTLTAASPSDTVTLHSYANPFTDAVDYDKEAREIIGLLPTPNLIVASSSVAFDNLIKAVENNWLAVAGSAPRPVYLLWEKLPALVSQFRQRPDLPGRVFGVEPLKSSAVENVYSDFSNAYRAKYNQVLPLYGMEYAFDAFYAVIYALHAAAAKGPLEQVNGGQFREALLSLNAPATAVPVGRTDVTTFFNLLSAGSVADVDLVGSATDLEFDTLTLSPFADGQLYCVDATVNADAGAQTVYRYTGKTFSATTGGAMGSSDVTGCSP